MPSIPTANTAALHVRGSVDGQFTENILYYEFASAIASGDLASLAIATAALVISEWLPLLSTEWMGREVYVEDLTSGSGLQYTDTSILGEVGTSAGQAYPNNSSLAIARKTGLAGRSFMGRIFWQTIDASLLSSVNTVSSAKAADIIDAIQAIDAAAVLLDWTPVVVSLFSLGAPRVAGVTTPITTWTVTNLVLDSRQRRLPGRGM